MIYTILLCFVTITVIVAVPIAHPDEEEEAKPEEEETKPLEDEDDLGGVVDVDWESYLPDEDAGSGDGLSLEDTIRNSMNKVSTSIRDRIQAIPFAI
uniref:Putative secreted peptide n=1 Tax=Anopheles braziliensis TaxID=58242 RepID=A0A2M3ZEB1_9DIPT